MGTLEGAIAALRARFRGSLLQPEEPGYDEARRVWNGSIDRHPALVARCTGTADVVAAVEFGRELGLLTAVRGGGHNIAGNATCERGLVIDLSRMKGVRVDLAARTLTAQPGCVWGDVDHETQAFGLAVPGGIVSTTGIAGFTVGGGFGHLTRRLGFASDNLVSADVVTAEGRVLRASREENPDLFWGIRGGGGNFGIVASFEYRLHEAGPLVLGGLVFQPAARAPALLRFLRDWLPGTPEELTVFTVLRKAPALPAVPAQFHGQPVVANLVCWSGSLERGEAVLRPLRAFAPPLADLIKVRPYVEVQSLTDGAWTPGLENYWKSDYITGLPDGAVDVLSAHLATISSPLSDFKIAYLGGVAARLPDDSALSHREQPWLLNINTRWTPGDDREPHLAWTRSLFDAMQPFSAGSVYVNFLMEEGAGRVRMAYSREKWARLQALKRKYDPENFFRLNQNIPPGGA